MRSDRGFLLVRLTQGAEDESSSALEETGAESEISLYVTVGTLILGPAIALGAVLTMVSSR